MIKIIRIYNEELEKSFFETKCIFDPKKNILVYVDQDSANITIDISNKKLIKKSSNSSIKLDFINNNISIIDSSKGINFDFEIKVLESDFSNNSIVFKYITLDDSTVYYKVDIIN